MFSYLKNPCKILIIALLTLLIISSLIISFSLFYCESPFKCQFKSSVPKIQQFASSTQIDKNLLDVPSNSPYLFYRLEEENYEKLHFQEKKSPKESNEYDFVLFVPGHKGSHTQIIQLQGYLYAKFKTFNLQSFHFKFFSIDFLHSPSAFSSPLLERQSEFIVATLKYLASRCRKKQQRITIIAHSMGGISTLLALSSLAKQKEQSYTLRMIEKVIFLNSPLGSHPVNTDYKLLESYSRIYEFFYKRTSLENIIFISFSGNKADYEVNGEISRLHVNENFKDYYHFFTNDVRGVYLHLRHVETLTNPFFLFKMSDFLIDFYINKLNRIPFNIYWYFQHLNRQIHSVKGRKLNDTESFWETLRNFTEFNISQESCKERVGISSGFYTETCRIFNFQSENNRNIVIRAQNGPNLLRVYIYFKESLQKRYKIITISPEYNFDFYPEMNFKYYYVIPDQFVQKENTNFKLVIVKSEKTDKNYQILSERPRNVEKTIDLMGILLGTELKIDLNENFTLNVGFDTNLVFNPLFMDIKVTFNSSKYKSNDIILLVYHWKPSEENSTNLNEVQLLSTRNESFVTQEVLFPKFKLLQLIFPFQKNCSASVFVTFSFKEALHFIGRNAKHDVLALVPCATLLAIVFQLKELWKKQETKSLTRVIFGNFIMWAFFLGNFNIIYLGNISQSLLMLLGFHTGETTMGRYPLLIMDLIVPSVALLLTMYFFAAFCLLFKVLSIFANLLAFVSEKISKKNAFLMILCVQVAFFVSSIFYEEKWVFYPLSLLLGITADMAHRNKNSNGTNEIAKSFFFVSFFYYLTNCSRLLLLMEHWQSKDDLFLEEFLGPQDDFIQYCSLNLWILTAELLENVEHNWKGRYLFLFWLVFTISVMLLLGSGRIFFMNYVLSLSVVGFLAIRLVT